MIINNSTELKGMQSITAGCAYALTTHEADVLIEEFFDNAWRPIITIRPSDTATQLIFHSDLVRVTPTASTSFGITKVKLS